MRPNIFFAPIFLVLCFLVLPAGLLFGCAPGGGRWVEAAHFTLLNWCAPDLFWGQVLALDRRFHEDLMRKEYDEVGSDQASILAVREKYLGEGRRGGVLFVNSVENHLGSQPLALFEWLSDPGIGHTHSATCGHEGHEHEGATLPTPWPTDPPRLPDLARSRSLDQVKCFYWHQVYSPPTGAEVLASENLILMDFYQPGRLASFSQKIQRDLFLANLRTRAARVDVYFYYDSAPVNRGLFQVAATWSLDCMALVLDTSGEYRFLDVVTQNFETNYVFRVFPRYPFFELIGSNDFNPFSYDTVKWGKHGVENEAENSVSHQPGWGE